MHARTLVVTALIAVSATLGACSSDNTLGLGVAGGTNGDTLSNARIRFVNATASSFDIASSGVVAAGNGGIGFGTSSTCISTTAATPNVSVRLAGTTTAVPGFTTAYQSGVSYIVIAYPGTGGVTTFATIADTFIPGVGQVGFRVFNAGAAGTTYDVYLTAPGASLTTATPSVAGLTSGVASGFVAVSATATQQVRVTAGGSKTALIDLGNLVFVAGQNVTLVIAPPLAGSTTPRAFLVVGC